MKRINFNIKDRKVLYGILTIALICVFTLTIAYAALNAVLTISGNARVSAADWDIYLNNPRVTNGSATTNVPEIKTSSTLEFETTLNMPGDFYEFTVDVVNGGDIDAMIENVVKTPDLTEEISQYISDTTSENDKDLVDLYVEIYDVDLGIQIESKSSASIRACNELLGILDAYSQESDDDDEDEVSQDDNDDDDSSKMIDDKKSKSEKIYYSIN